MKRINLGNDDPNGGFFSRGGESQDNGSIHVETISSIQTIVKVQSPPMPPAPNKERLLPLHVLRTEGYPQAEGLMKKLHRGR